MNEKGNISINTENIFPIIKKWLYSDRDIFLREIVSNACDAISKIKKLISLNEVQGIENSDFKITVSRIFDSWIKKKSPKALNRLIFLSNFSH